MLLDKTNAEFVAIAEMHVAALSEAPAGIPRERAAAPLQSSNEAPHTHDTMREILPVPLLAKVGALSIEFANPRHQHGTQRSRRFCRWVHPIPGVIDTTTNFVSIGSSPAHLRGDRRGQRPRASSPQRLRLRHLRFTGWSPDVRAKLKAP